MFIAEDVNRAGGRFQYCNMLRIDSFLHHGVENEYGNEIFEKGKDMELGLIGLGKMGSFMAERLRLGGHKVVGFDSNAEAVKNLTAS
ncbi:MAG: NAD(P)-binding domain-containing protein, partial [Acidobacteriaceae bacterium]